MRILFLSRWFPHPPSNGSKLRIYNLIKGLSINHEVTLLSFADEPADTMEMHKFCPEVKVVPWKEFDPTRWKARLGIFRLEPRSIVDTYSIEMAEAITETLHSAKHDLVIASQLQMAAYASRFRDVPSIFEEFEIGLFHDRVFSSDGRTLHIRYALTWFKLRLYLSRLLNTFQACTVASKQEAQLLQRNFPAYRKPITVIPNGVDINEYRNFATEKKPNTLVFTGSFGYRANYEAMLWFVEKVFPLILQRLPDTRLFITGDHQNLPLSSQKNITLTGHVDNLKTLVASAAVSIAPLLSGGGTRLKILEAMALRTPVVATSKGAEGLEVMPGEHLLVADTPADFAGCVIRLLTDDESNRRLAKNAFQLVQERYNWDTMIHYYTNLIESVTR